MSASSEGVRGGKRKSGSGIGGGGSGAQHGQLSGWAHPSPGCASVAVSRVDSLQTPDNAPPPPPPYSLTWTTSRGRSIQPREVHSAWTMSVDDIEMLSGKSPPSDGDSGDEARDLLPLASERSAAIPLDTSSASPPPHVPQDIPPSMFSVTATSTADFLGSHFFAFLVASWMLDFTRPKLGHSSYTGACTAQCV